MNRGSCLNHSDHNEFWIHVYLGSGPDWLEACLKRAYLDVSRTVHGIGGSEVQSTLTEDATRALKDRFLKLQRQLPAGNAAAFDAWHHATCQELIDLYARGGYPRLCVGQAQKWVNMTLKYASLLGSRLPAYGDIYDLCHMPIDNVVLDALDTFGPPPGLRPWSQVGWDRYMSFQIWVRQRFVVPALDVEFRAWMLKNNLSEDRQFQTWIR